MIADGHDIPFSKHKLARCATQAVLPVYKNKKAITKLLGITIENLSAVLSNMRAACAPEQAVRPEAQAHLTDSACDCAWANGGNDNVHFTL